MEIKRHGSQTCSKAPPEGFNGKIRGDPLFSPTNPVRANGTSFTFEPGGRTTWHTHPLDLTPLVSAGSGRVQR